MRTFHCDQCGQPLFFENVRCLRCGSDLAFLPDKLVLGAIEPVPGDRGLWRRRLGTSHAGGRTYHLCRNHTDFQACNFAVPASDPNPLCVSCRQTRILPDLSVADHHARWYRIQVAKRRLFYTLAKLGLVMTEPPDGERDGPVFEFLADLPGQQVITGHLDGVITLNVAEADDAERVRRRIAMHEPYRTLLGHLRHESGHYYWDRLIRDGGRLDEFRAMFGDERADYGEALQAYYARGGGTVDGWQEGHVSAYATSHAWEDWAETWAHYLHMIDLLETAASYDTQVAVPGNDASEAVKDPFARTSENFEELVAAWVPLTLLLNSLNRSLGQDDAYPFALSAHALTKLRFVHDMVHAPRSRRRANAARIVA
jgi:hypothetical protein